MQLLNEGNKNRLPVGVVLDTNGTLLIILPLQSATSVMTGRSDPSSDAFPESLIFCVDFFLEVHKALANL